MADQRLEKIRARVARLRAAEPVDVAADPGTNALRMIAKLDADDLAYLLDENERLRRELERRDSVPFPAHRTLALTKEKAELEADLAAARERETGLREALDQLNAAVDGYVELHARGDRRDRVTSSDELKAARATARAALAREDRE